MADNTPLNPGTGGDTYRNIDKGGVKTTVVILDLGAAGAEALLAALTAIPGLAAASIPVREARQAATGTRTLVLDSATEVLILAANAARIGATIMNDCSAMLRLGLGTAAVTLTDYTVKVPPNGYYEVPAWYSGQIRGMWSSDPGDGGALVTELT